MTRYKSHPTHDFPPFAWRCTKCGALLASIDAEIRCEPVEEGK